ncbi:Hsp33 family molecular chaperone HslO [Alteromonadaceae bacterium BrNp21-10]|nr:Hsp33 family molecular chaperone HslO [Alteromonadaceae bacterium BrNp21-10]
MQLPDQLHRYVFTKADVRGELVQLQQSFQQVLAGQDYPPAIQQLLGELMAATALLTATLKFEGEIALQLQSEGIVKYAVINGSHDQKLRGVARWQGDVPTDDFAALFEKGVMVITITPKKGERYQGIVALDQPSLAACVEAYFMQSEQLPTHVVLAADITKGAEQAAGMLLQVLPSEDKQHDDFEHLRQLTASVKSEELFNLSAQDVLYRLYHQEEVELYAPQALEFHCGCSKARSATALASVEKQELLDLIAEDGCITMNCQYCQAEYQFDAIDVEAIHAGQFGDESQH